ncbi:hypothetical protein V8C34DRAFT_207470 [Trichoderma compactum]
MKLQHESISLSLPSFAQPLHSHSPNCKTVPASIRTKQPASAPIQQPPLIDWPPELVRCHLETRPDSKHTLFDSPPSKHCLPTSISLWTNCVPRLRTNLFLSTAVWPITGRVRQRQPMALRRCSAIRFDRTRCDAMRYVCEQVLRTRANPRPGALAGNKGKKAKQIGSQKIKVTSTATKGRVIGRQGRASLTVLAKKEEERRERERSDARIRAPCPCLACLTV